jgi:peroxiredoxin Q/BCP
MSGISLSDFEELPDAVDRAVSYMDDTPADRETAVFDGEIPNAVMKPVSVLANNVGGSQVSIRTTEDLKVPGIDTDENVVLESGSHGPKMQVLLPSGAFDSLDIDRNGTAVTSLDTLADFYRSGKKSDSAGIAVTDSGGLYDIGEVQYTRATATRSTKVSNPYQSTFNPPADDEDTARLETTGRELEAAIKAVTIPTIGNGASNQRDYDITAVMDVSEDGVFLLYESDTGDSVKAEIGQLEDDVTFSGSARVAIRVRTLRAFQKAVPKPASTTVNMLVYEGSHINASYIDEGAMYEVWLPEPDETPDFSLSQPGERVSIYCGGYGRPSDAGRCASVTLAQSGLLAEGDDAPTWTGTAHTGEEVTATTDDSVVWFFPNTNGCRCSAQAMQFDQLQDELDTTVYGITNDSPDELAQMADQFDLGITLVSDPDGEIAQQYGVTVEDAPERAAFFVRDGQVVESVNGMTDVRVAQPGELNEATTLNPFADYDGWDDCVESNQDKRDPQAYCAAIKRRTEGKTASESDDVPEIAQQLEHPSVGLITGRRGSGKSSLAYHLAEEMHKRDGTIPVTIGLPPDKADALPQHWMNVSELDAAPPQSVIVVDEAYAKFHARQAMQNVGLSSLINQSRHCAQSMLFVTQNSGHLDKNAVSEADAMFIKEPGTFHKQFERAPVRAFTEEAESAFDQLPANLDKRRYVYTITDDRKALIENGEADFYDGELSKSFSNACTSDNTGEQQLSQPIPCLSDLPDDTPAFSFICGSGDRLDRLTR